jgi:lantibiotic modifying enzyme
MQEVATALKSCDSSHVMVARSSLCTDKSTFGKLARRLGDTLLYSAQLTTDGKGAAWISSHHSSKGLPLKDINSGLSGPVLGLAEILSEQPDNTDFSGILRKGAYFLKDAEQPSYIEGPTIPGLYIGEAGVGAALLRAGQVMNDETLINAARERSLQVAKLPQVSPDLFNGTAGRLRFHLFVFDHTQDEQHLTAARGCGDFLLSIATTENGESKWNIPDNFGRLSGTSSVGYSHGAAGIADALLDLWEATGEEKYLAPVKGAAAWLQRIGVPAFEDKGVAWPAMEGGMLHPPFWCHGATGIGKFFLHLSRLEINPDAQKYALKAAWSSSHGIRFLSPTQCHGLSGNIEFLLDVYQHTGDPSWLNQALELAELLQAWAVEHEGRLYFPSEDPYTLSPDYMVGYVGVAMCLLRLADPENRPHQLSRAGFQYRPPKQEKVRGKQL